MDLERKIRQRAFRIWVEEGHPVGKRREHWERAKAEVLAEEPAFSSEVAGWDAGSLDHPEGGAGEPHGAARH